MMYAVRLYRDGGRRDLRMATWLSKDDKETRLETERASFSSFQAASVHAREWCQNFEDRTAQVVTLVGF